MEMLWRLVMAHFGGNVKTLERTLVATVEALPHLIETSDKLDALALINRIVCDLTLEIYQGTPIDAYIFLASRGVAKEIDRDILEKIHNE
jgi:hypothetical protein